MSTSYTNVAYIKVAPGIGVGRVGNSTEYFLGPEVPGVVPSPNNQDAAPTPPSDPTPEAYKDASGAVKPQAQRFKVFAYDDSDTFLGEITNGSSVNGTIVNIDWQVHVTNMKSANYCFQGKYAFDPAYLRNSTIQADMPIAERTNLIIDPGLKTVMGNSATPVELLDPVGSVIFNVADEDAKPLSSNLRFDPPQDSTDPVDVTYTSATVSLGNIRTDADGRLIFVGGAGVSESCTSPKVVITKLSLPSGLDASNVELNPEYNLNSYFNNPGWYDDTCGGSIDVILRDATTKDPVMSTNGEPRKRGWVAVAPPHYAPSTYNVVSLLDLQLDIFPEADPNTGAGPFYIAQNNNSAIQILTTSEAANPSTQIPGTFYSVSDTAATPFETVYQPSLVSYQGENYIAAVDTTGLLHLGVEDTPSTYTFSQIDLGSGVTATSAPSLTVWNNQLYVAFNSSGTLYLGVQSAGTFTFSTIGLASGLSINPEDAPALAVFNGDLYVSAVSSSNRLIVGNSGQTADKSIVLSPVDITNSANNESLFPTRQSLISMVFHGSKLYLGFVSNSDSSAYVVSTENGTSYQGSLAPVANGDGSQAVTPGYGVSLSSFNGILYYGSVNNNSEAVIGQLAEDTIPDVIHSRIYTIEGSASAMPVLSTNISVNFYRDIYPTLKTVTDYAWTNERAFHGHRPGTMGDFLHVDYLQALASPEAFDPTSQNANISRPFVFNFIRPPSQEIYLSTASDQPYRVPAPPTAAVPGGNVANGVQIQAAADAVQRSDLMPRLFGNGGSPLENSINDTIFPNQWLPLTRHQLEKFQLWVNGNFETGTLGEDQYPDLNEAEQLSFAALQPTVGGGFHPGIELTYLMHERTFFDGPFQFAEKTIPGEIAAYMSVPWQGDFWSCNVSWWPSLRPDIVVESSTDTPPVLTHKQWFRGSTIPPDSNNISDYEGGYAVMVDGWKDLGFVTPVQGVFDRGQQVYSETERNPALNLPSLLTSIDYGDLSTGKSVSVSGTTVSAATTAPSEPAQQWALISSTAQAGYFTIQEAVPETLDAPNALTADFSSNEVTAAALSPYGDANQLWSYVATEVQPAPGAPITGYPGHFMLKNQSTLKVLTVNADFSLSTIDAETSPTSSSSPQLWRLDSASSS